ncbi:MAG: hypothetical protein L7S52_03585 [Flavobacteriaceae bacterium]|nr:hypothetical protein [Flavobacteriaceae bacterium]
MSKINVLIVEDEKENAELLLHFIKKYCPMIAGVDQAGTQPLMASAGHYLTIKK